MLQPDWSVHPWSREQFSLQFGLKNLTLNKVSEMVRHI